MTFQIFCDSMMFLGNIYFSCRRCAKTLSLVLPHSKLHLVGVLLLQMFTIINSKLSSPGPTFLAEPPLLTGSFLPPPVYFSLFTFSFPATFLSSQFFLADGSFLFSFYKRRELLKRENFMTKFSYFLSYSINSVNLFALGESLGLS